MKKINSNILMAIGTIWVLVYHYSSLTDFFVLVSFGKKSISFKTPKWFINFYYSIKVYAIALRILFFTTSNWKYFNIYDWMQSYYYNQKSHYPYKGNFLEYVFYTDSEITLDKIYNR